MCEVRDRGEVAKVQGHGHVEASNAIKEGTVDVGALSPGSLDTAFRIEQAMQVSSNIRGNWKHLAGLKLNDLLRTWISLQRGGIAKQTLAPLERRKQQII